MIVYKLCRKLKDGSISSLFINKKNRIKLGEWLEAENHPTNGFANRPYWHCVKEMLAPHLKENGRVWMICEIDDNTQVMERPKSQGGVWYLAKRIKFISEVK
jgi:hypothetical protein